MARQKTNEQRALDALLAIAEGDLCETDRIAAARAILEHGRATKQRETLNRRIGGTGWYVNGGAVSGVA